MPAITLKLLSLILFLTPQALALVDYTEEEAFTPNNSGASTVRQAQAPVPMAKSQTRPKRSRGSDRGMGFQLNAGVSYGSQDVEIGSLSGKVDTMAFEAQIQTRYNVFLSTSFNQYKSSDSEIVNDETGFQVGNPELILGFNWLQFGKPSEMATIDLYGGLAFSQSDSDFATTRSDRLVGVSTAKRFHQLALGLGYELRMTGEAEGSELNIGNISKLSASLGWVVSNDIRFLVEGHTYTVRAGESEGLNLTEEIEFSVLKPQLQLKISPLIDLALGATLRTRRAKEEALTGAKLWNLEGAYGSGLFAGLSINI